MFQLLINNNKKAANQFVEFPLKQNFVIMFKESSFLEENNNYRKGPIKSKAKG